MSTLPSAPTPGQAPSWPEAEAAATHPWTWCDVAVTHLGSGSGADIAAWRPASEAWQALQARHGVRVAMSQRHGGVSQGGCAGLNLGSHVGDDPAHVAENRRRWQAWLGVPAAYLDQVHGVAVVEAQAALHSAPFTADAVWTAQPGLACQAMVADCLPVVFAHRQGVAVGAAHAGWRGLAAGVLEQCLATLCQATGSRPDDFIAWGGACIGPQAFEVGLDVREAFPLDGAAFQPRHDAAGKLWAHLPWLAQRRLARAGLTQFSWSGICTVSSPADAYSHRREPRGGRMVAAIWREGQGG